MTETFGILIGVDSTTPISAVSIDRVPPSDITGMLLRESFPERSMVIESNGVPAPLQPLSIEAQRDAFIQKYQITKLDSSQVALTLPEGTTRIEFLKEAQALSIALHSSKPEKYQAAQAVYPKSLASWKSERGFTDATEKALPLRVDGNVKDSTNHTRLEQESNGWCDVALQDLAVAHTAFYLLTGKDLFEGNVVRAVGGSLSFYANGLDEGNYYNAARYSNVSASRSLPVPN